MIGGQGDRVLRIVAEHADIWNYPGSPGEQFRLRDQVLNEHCSAIGRDPATIARSMQIIVRCDEPGAPATARAELFTMIEAGVTHPPACALLWGRPGHWLPARVCNP